MSHFSEIVIQGMTDPSLIVAALQHWGFTPIVARYAMCGGRPVFTEELEIRALNGERQKVHILIPHDQFITYREESLGWRWNPTSGDWTLVLPGMVRGTQQFTRGGYVPTNLGQQLRNEYAAQLVMSRASALGMTADRATQDGTLRIVLRA